MGLSLIIQGVVVMVKLKIFCTHGSQMCNLETFLATPLQPTLPGATVGERPEGTI